MTTNLVRLVGPDIRGRAMPTRQPNNNTGDAMRTNLENALTTLITAGWANRSADLGGAVMSIIDATTERAMLEDILSEVDYLGAPTIDDVPPAWYVVVEFNDGMVFAKGYPTEAAAEAVAPA